MKLIHAVKAQIYLMVHKRNFWLSFYIMMGYSICTYLYHLSYYWEWDVINIYTSSYLFAGNGISPYLNIFLTLYPFIVTLTFSFSYFDDQKYAIHTFFICRTERRNYYIAKAVACLVGNMMVIVVPFMVNIFLNKITFPNNGLTMYGTINTAMQYVNIFDRDVSPVRAMYPFISVYIYHPTLYNLFFSVYLGLVSGVFGIFSYCCSILIRKNKILIFLPFYTIFFLSNRYYRYFFYIDLSRYIILERWNKERLGIIFGICGLLLVVSGVLIHHALRKDYEQ